MFNILVDQENEHLLGISKVIRQQLQEVGIEIKIHLFSDYAELLKKLKQGADQFQGYLLAFSTGTDPDTTSRYWETGEIFNYGAYHDMIVDRLFLTGRKTQDQNERTKAYQEIHHQIAETQPAVFLYIPYVFYGCAKSVFRPQDFLGPFISFQHLNKIYKLDVKTNERG